MKCHNNRAYIIQVWSYEGATSKPAVCLEGTGRDFFSQVKYDQLIAAIPSYSGVGANQVKQLWVHRFQKVTIFGFAIQILFTNEQEFETP